MSFGSRVGLVALVIAGGIAGYYLIDAVAGPRRAAPPAVQEETAGSVPEDLPPLDTRIDLTPPSASRGSNLSVVGGLSAEEMRKLSDVGGNVPVQDSPPPLQVDRGSQPGGAPQGGIVPTTTHPPSEGPPVAESFPPEVQAAARRYLCLCGCPDNLAVCACNEQPVGAGTMLSHLEKLIEQGSNDDEVDAGMVDRYGERVLAP